MYRTLGDFVAAVKADDWEAAWAGDEAARRRIAEALEGVDLYYHAGPALGAGYSWVGVADLICHGIVRRVTLHADE